MKKVLAGVLVLALLITGFSVFSLAGSIVNQVDDELITILYEKTDNPQLWLDYIESQKNDETGMWLPALIKKLVSQDADMTKALIEPSYTVVHRPYDWGAAVDKIIVDFGQDINPEVLDKDIFTISSSRTFKDFSFATFSLAENPSAHLAPRTILDAYVCDADGQAAESGQYVAFELEVGPTLSEGATFNYNFANSFNEPVVTSYEISVVPGNAVIAADSSKLIIQPTSASEKAGEIMITGDDYIHDQAYSQDGIDLLYASYSPSTLSEEADTNPLIIWLHGAGEGGMDTTIPVMANEAGNLASSTIQQYFGETGAYVLVPQNQTVWMDIDGTKTYNTSVPDSDGASYYTEALMGLIQSFVDERPDIDTNRIYIGGCSNGGYMTVNMVINYPEYFAAAFPICAPYNTDWITDERIEALSSIPVWFTHAVTDSVVPIAEGTGGVLDFMPTLDENNEPTLLDQNTVALYDRMIAGGDTSVYFSLFDKVVDTSGNYFQADGTRPYEYMGHWSWIYTLNNECVETIDDMEVTIFDWLSQQSR